MGEPVFLGTSARWSRTRLRLPCGLKHTIQAPVPDTFRLFPIDKA